MKELLTYVAQNLVDHPDQVSVTQHESDGETVLELRVAPEDMGKVIGRQGRIAKEIRTLIRSVAQRTGQRVSVESSTRQLWRREILRHCLTPEERRIPMKEQYLEVGKITNVHGIMGEVRVQPWADSPDFLCQFKTLYVDSSHWPIQVERARVHKNMVILKLQGVTDVNSALAMRNAVLYIDRKDVQLPEGSFFLADLMGMEVRDAASGAVLGQIADILTLPANNVYVVRGGARELMIPAVDQFIAEVNVDEGYLRVNMMEGL